MSTDIKSTGLVTLTIKTEGKAIPDVLDIQSVHIEKGVNRVSMAKISINDRNLGHGDSVHSLFNLFILKKE